MTLQSQGIFPKNDFLISPESGVLKKKDNETDRLSLVIMMMKILRVMTHLKIPEKHSVMMKIIMQQKTSLLLFITRSHLQGA